MSKLFIGIIAIFSFLLISCSTSNPVTVYSNTDADTKTNDIAADKDVIIPAGDSDEVAKPDEDTDVFKEIPSCKLDSECGGAPMICVGAKCVEGCKSDSDCSAYKGTRCNTKLGRCLNLAASSQACGESKCATGCCYAAKGFISLSCAKTPDLKVCGICKQGEVYMDGKTCIPAACDSSTDKCSSYNSSDPKTTCFQCKAGELVCYLNETGCKGTGSGFLVNAAQCIPAGEACAGNGTTCCSGQPCIQGYCY